MQSRLWAERLGFRVDKGIICGNTRCKNGDFKQRLSFYGIHGFQAFWGEWRVSLQWWGKNTVLCLKVAVGSSGQEPVWRGLGQMERGLLLRLAGTQPRASSSKGPPLYTVPRCGTDCCNVEQRPEMGRACILWLTAALNLQALWSQLTPQFFSLSYTIWQNRNLVSRTKVYPNQSNLWVRD